MPGSSKVLKYGLGAAIIAAFLVVGYFLYHGPLSSYMASKGYIAFSDTKYKGHLPSCRQLSRYVFSDRLTERWGVDFSPDGRRGKGALNWVSRICGVEYDDEGRGPCLVGVYPADLKCNHFMIHMSIREYDSLDKAESIFTEPRDSLPLWPTDTDLLVGDDTVAIPLFIRTQPTETYLLSDLSLSESALRVTDDLLHTVGWERVGEDSDDFQWYFSEYRIIARLNAVVFELLSQSSSEGDQRDLDLRSEATQTLMDTILANWGDRRFD